MNDNVAKTFDFLVISLSILYNYFNDLTKLFSNLFLAEEFLDTLAKSFFPCGNELCYKPKMVLPNEIFRTQLSSNANAKKGNVSLYHETSS